ELELVGEILESHIDMGGGRKRSVSQILSDPGIYAECAYDLERYGVALVDDRDGPRSDFEARSHVFVNLRAVSRHLLAKTKWASQRVDDIFFRIPGAKRDQRTIAGVRQRGFLIPRESFVSVYEKGEKMSSH